VKHGRQLALDRCPHCGIAKPRIDQLGGQLDTKDYRGKNARIWVTYSCASCGGVILAVAPAQPGAADIAQMWPPAQAVAEELPQRAKDYLSQAIASIHAPVGAVITAASAVDAMLKAKGYKDGSLYSRIDAAATNHLITSEMAAWAHEIRLEANDQRHADNDAPLPTPDDAVKVIEFAAALGQFLFVLPARVERGRKGPQPPSA
jgi:hypothetical protein